jgi:hypothetical protein
MRRTIALIVLSLSLGPSSRVLAQSSKDAVAEALFDEGRKLLDEGLFDEACAKFEASRKIDSGVGTLLFLGECYQRAGRFASAWARFREAASLAGAAKDNREAVAAERASKLEPSLFRLTITAPERVSGLVVSLDGEPIPEASLGLALPTDAGAHTIEASAPGHEPWSRTLTLPKTGGSETVSVPALAAVPRRDDATSRPLPRATEGGPSGVLIGGVVVAGFGAAALGVAGALVGVASGRYSDADAFCDEFSCSTQEGVDLSGEARTLGDAATGVFIGGLALAGAGLTMILVGALSSDAPASDATAQGSAPRVLFFVAPELGGGATVHAGGSF